MVIGIVKWFDSEKGYGYIWPEDGSEDTFVDLTALEHSGLRTLNKGQLVQFEMQRDQLSRRRKAAHIITFN
jgi:CspA family cold shock protein